MNKILFYAREQLVDDNEKSNLSSVQYTFVRLAVVRQTKAFIKTHIIAVSLYEMNLDF